MRYSTPQHSGLGPTSFFSVFIYSFSDWFPSYDFKYHLFINNFQFFIQPATTSFNSRLLIPSPSTLLFDDSANIWIFFCSHNPAHPVLGQILCLFPCLALLVTGLGFELRIPDLRFLRLGSWVCTTVSAHVLVSSSSALPVVSPYSRNPRSAPEWILLPSPTKSNPSVPSACLGS